MSKPPRTKGLTKEIAIRLANKAKTLHYVESVKVAKPKKK